jgi:DNA-binding CsgD family transcriptional regulator
MPHTIAAIYFVDKPVIQVHSNCGMTERKQDKKEQALRAKLQLKQRAHDMLIYEGKSKIDISVELGISRPTLNSWLKETGAEDKRKFVVVANEDKPIGENLDKFLDASLTGSLPPINKNLKDAPSPEEVYDARIQEKADIALAADSNMTPAERYAAYIAAQGIRMIRDAIPNIRVPTTVKDLEVLDGIIRRNLGLDKKGGGGALKIDVNILNNSKASPKGAVIDVKPN